MSGGFAPAGARSYCFVSVVVVDEPAGVFVVVVEVEDSLLGGLTMVVSFFSPGGFTTVVLLSPGGTLTRVSQAVSASASVAQRIIDFIVVYFSWPALPYRGLQTHSYSPQVQVAAVQFSLRYGVARFFGYHYGAMQPQTAA